MTQNTETDIHIYNSTCSQLDGISTHHRPQDGSRGRITRRKSRLKARSDQKTTENNGNWRYI